MLQGRVVTIRTMERSDLVAVKAINDDPQVRRNVVGWGWPNSQAEMERWFEGSQGGSTHRWIIEGPAGEVIGVTGLWDVDLQGRHALSAVKIGGALGERGRGAGTDAIMLVGAFAYYDLGLNRLYGSILTSNAASYRAYVDKCNWRLEGTARQHVWRGGSAHDLHLVACLKSDFDEHPDAAEYIARVTGL